MSQPIDKATIVNRALGRLGQAPVFSLDGENHVTGHVDGVWDDVVAECFGLHDWSFCRRTTKLTRLAVEPGNGWSYGFALPGDRIGEPLLVLAAVAPAEHVLRDFSIEAGVLYARAANVWARCKVAVDPEAWDIGFRGAFVTALASALAVPMQSDQGLQDDLRAQAFGTPSQGGTGGQFGRLVAQNRAGSPVGSPFLRGDPLTDARWG
ncbi:hypothetical protein D3218_00355 [Aureimonas flava]|uniref:Uncharacterized protein n=1 Tax=Aureimonas flava TaxID=2320271 RepID=A0A3A1WW68_9HYPH|nr:hypothetical protein [Aureimonas flava]RIY03262.1 hypothetical protein D3218_00355 [Aureimonas flava]